MGAFVISQRFNLQYKFAFTSRKGKTIFSSYGYDTKQECADALKVLQENLHSVTYKRSKTTAGKFSFHIYLADQKVAVSRKYSTELRLLKAIDEISGSAALAETLDFSDTDFAFPD